ncbi:unnamed protein product [Brachionus calyciflorus]|uniref:Peptidase S1 domain-containing protein n=1 Tax=Brachionus calyciflorus TaxID=104777 RepID=A0A814MI07_9BILA|nr:unnamed protein product [Brachionus calyciflorus]
MSFRESLGKKKNEEKQETQKDGTQNKIINGKPVKADHNPWMVSIDFLDANGYSHFCGGSIITKRHILTEAHCVTDLGNNFDYREYLKKNGKFLVDIIGVEGLEKNKDIFSLFVYTNMMLITNITYNTKYTNTSGPYDVAVLKINREFSFSHRVSKINLPYTNNPNIVFGRVSQIAGWGITENNTASIDVLYAHVNIIN